MQSINPATGELMKEFKCLTKEQAFAELKKSRAASKEWSALDIKERCGYLKKLASVLKKNSAEYGKFLTLEMGKPLSQAKAEVEKSAWACEYYAENAERFLADETIKTEAKKSYIALQPLGTILGVMPWNYPFWQVFRFSPGTLAAGNTVVVKHASNVPQSAIAIEDTFKQAGFPDDVYKNLIIGSDLIEPMIESDLIDAVSLTGSTEAGKKVGEVAGRNIKKAVLELGGSDAFIILDDADVKMSADIGVKARFQNTGQSCIAAKRFVVHKDVAGEFKDRFVGHAEKLVVGDPMSEKTDLGPVARGDLRDTLERQVKTAVGNGAKVLLGGNKMEGKGYFFEPSVLEAKKDNAVVLKEELFGPAASIIVAKNDEELVDIVNSTPYGLGASIWGSDLARAEKIARKLQVGMVAINSMLKSDPRLPFGGMKKSGIGRELSEYGIMEFVNVKSISVF
jgi:succinate-semialdehyde dehydrogenase/glutarate-semialdehyde dehydrogenase